MRTTFRLTDQQMPTAILKKLHPGLMNSSLGLMQRCWVVWTTMALGGLATFGTAQATNGSASTHSDTGARPLSLAAAQRAALEKNWDLLAAAAEIDMATAQKIVSSEF